MTSHALKKLISFKASSIVSIVIKKIMLVHFISWQCYILALIFYGFIEIKKKNLKALNHLIFFVGFLKPRSLWLSIKSPVTDAHVLWYYLWHFSIFVVSNFISFFYMYSANLTVGPITCKVLSGVCQLSNTYSRLFPYLK